MPSVFQAPRFWLWEKAVSFPESLWKLEFLRKGHFGSSSHRVSSSNPAVSPQPITAGGSLPGGPRDGSTCLLFRDVHLTHRELMQKLFLVTLRACKMLHSHIPCHFPSFSLSFSSAQKGSEGKSSSSLSKYISNHGMKYLLPLYAE